MRQIRSGFGAVLLLVASACSKGARPPDDSATAKPAGQVDAGAACSLHFTAGPIADPNRPCTIEADYMSSSLRSVVEIGGDSGQLTVHFNLTKPGELKVGTVTNADSGVTGLLDITNGDAGYEMTTTPGSETGTFTFTVTKVGVVTTSSSATNYALTGSLDVVVPADTTTAAKGTGPVTVHVVFGGN